MGRRGGRPSLKEGKSRVPSGRGRPFYIVARATPPAVGTGGVESVSSVGYSFELNYYSTVEQ